MVEIAFCCSRKINPIGFGDVAIPIHENDRILFEPTSTKPPAGFKRAVFEFKNGGTGFLISISEMQINGVTKKLGLLLTAAHIILDLKVGRQKKFVFSCKLENHKETAYFLNEFTNYTTSDHLCSTTNSFYCMPGDLAIFLVTLDNCDAQEYFEPLDQPFFTTDSKCFISGFPKCKGNLENCIPNENLSDTQVRDIGNKIFNSFSGLVHSHGSVINENDNLIEISCSATNGMSGSPIVCQGKYIGIYVGGPALPGQKEIVDAIKLVAERDYDQAYNIIKKTACYSRFYEHKTFDCFLEICQIVFVGLCAEDQLKNNKSGHEKRFKKVEKKPLEDIKIQDFIEKSYSFLHRLVGIYKDRLNFSANIGISYKNKVFREVDLYVQKFLTCGSQCFLSINDVIRFLND